MDPKCDTHHRTFKIKAYLKDADDDDTDQCFPLDHSITESTYNYTPNDQNRWMLEEPLQNQLKPLTNHFAEEGWSGAGRQVDANEVDWCTRQCHCNSHQRVDGITVEGNHYEENAAQAVDYWEEQRQLQGVDTGR